MRMTPRGRRKERDTSHARYRFRAIDFPLLKIEVHLMRIFSRSLLLIALVSPAVALAQFQKPTAEELKMTADPRTPGAAAVFLNVEQKADNVYHYESFYARIKVLTEKGKELATVEIPYSNDEYKREVKDIQARTIRPDGTIVPLVGKPADLLVWKSGSSRSGSKVFTLPSVEVGSILEYYYQIRNDDGWILPPSWDIQRTYPVRKAHYVFTPGSPDILYWTVLPQGVTVHKDITDRFTLDITDVPAAPNEEWMPPISSFLYKVWFYFKSVSVDDFWRVTVEDWSKSVDSYATPSKTLHAAVDSLLAPDDSDQTKAFKLYKAVQGLENTSFTREKSEAELKQLKQKEIKKAEDVWTQKGGNRAEIALLYLAMLRAAGLNASAMKVVNRDNGLFTAGYLSKDQLDDFLILVNLNGKELVTDPGEKMCPFLTVNWKHSGAGGIREAPTPGLATSPIQAYAGNRITRTADLTVDEQGSVTGSIRLAMTGQEALYWRQKALQVDETELKKQFVEWIEPTLPEGIETKFDRFGALDDPDVDLVAGLTVSGTAGTATAKRMMLPGSFFETRNHVPFVSEENRQEPVDMHYGIQVNDRVTYHLPEGLAMEGAPLDAKQTWAGRAAFIAKVTAGTNQVTASRSLARGFTFLPPDAYKDLCDFYQKMAAIDQQQIVLTRTANAKGN